MPNDSATKRPPRIYAHATVSEGKNAIVVKYDDDPEENIYYCLKENEYRATVSELTHCIDLSDKDRENHTLYFYTNEEEQEYLRDRYLLGAINVQRQITFVLLAPLSAFGLGMLIKSVKNVAFWEINNIPNILLVLAVYILVAGLSFIFTAGIPRIVVDAFALDRAYRDKKWKPQILSSIICFISTLILLWVVLFKFV